MDVTFLIGNGFDIGIGLATRYSDFYEVYCATPSTNEYVKQFKTDLLSDKLKKYEKWSDFEKGYGEYAAMFRADEYDEYIEVLYDFKRQFEAYIVEQEEMFGDSDVQALAHVLEGALSSYYQLLRGAPRKAIANLMKEHEDEGINYNFISFNYTHCLDRAWEYLQYQNDEYTGEVVHVHGETGEDYILMGVNDASQIKNGHFAENEEIACEVIKPRTNEEIRMNYAVDAEAVLRISEVICIYGMSLGDTDKIWWKNVAKCLESPDVQLVIMHYAPDYKSNRVYPWKKETERIRNRFFDLADLDETTRKRYDARVHIELNKNVFEMSSETENELVAGFDQIITLPD